MNPLNDNPLRSREDLQRAVRDLVAPLDQYTSASGASVLPGLAGATYSPRAAGLEGFARRLWGLAPLAAGGGTFAGWARIREGLAAGTDPAHPAYWGDPIDIDIRLVEMASLGFGLAMATAQLWDPLTPAAKANVQRWLSFASSRKMVDNNWQFFTVLANLGLEVVGLAPDRHATEAALDRIDAMALTDGWYSDGLTTQRDYYIAFAMHFYGLIYAARCPSVDPARAERFRARGAAFAADFAHWFTAQGSGLPFGRSLTYRFAQSSYWGALAYAGVEALPWGVVKGLLLRNIRWWADQPIFSDDGVLTLGYGYPNVMMIEQYSAPGSPYWALKSFLPLALPAEHPFWLAEEQPLPKMDALRILPHAGMVLMRDSDEDHLVALATGQWHNSWPMRFTEQKYSKFAYSTEFGFCVGIGQHWHDNMLSFSDDGRTWVGRVDSVEHRIDADGTLHSLWRPMSGVEVQTRIEPAGLGHRRTHRIRTNRRVHTVEAGFSVNIDTCVGELTAGRDTHVGEGYAIVQRSGIRDLAGGRKAVVSSIEPNVNVLHPRVAAPLLTQTLEPGEHQFSAFVLGTRTQSKFDSAWKNG